MPSKMIRDVESKQKFLKYLKVELCDDPLKQINTNSGSWKIIMTYVCLPKLNCTTRLKLISLSQLYSIHVYGMFNNRYVMKNNKKKFKIMCQVQMIHILLRLKDIIGYF